MRKRPVRVVDGILLLDKPAGLSSNGALQAVRRLYQAGKAGHTGSLDPLATGLLPICFGQATKLSGFLLGGDKRYVVRARLGEKTATGDREGVVTARSDPGELEKAALEALLPRFTGAIAQVPPMYSALKREGRPLYELARAGVEVERTAREVTIRELRLLEFGQGEIKLSVSCSKGTYIRTLVEDLAAAVGQCAHVIELRRIGAAPFDDRSLVSLDEVERAAADGAPALDALLLPTAAALSDWPKVQITEERAAYLGQGQAVRVAGAPKAGLVAVVDATGRLLGIAEPNADGLLAPRRWMA